MCLCADVLSAEVVETTIEMVPSEVTEMISAWFVEALSPSDVVWPPSDVVQSPSVVVKNLVVE